MTEPGPAPLDPDARIAVEQLHALVGGVIDDIGASLDGIRVQMEAHRCAHDVLHHVERSRVWHGDSMRAAGLRRPSGRR